MTVWYDYTTSLRAISRNGIAATEWWLGQSLTDAAPGARCFQMDELGRLVEVDPHRDLAGAVYARSDTPPTQLGGVTTWRSRIRTGLSAALGPAALPIVHRVVRARLAIGRGKRRARALIRRDRVTPLAALVAPGDVIVTMGADWDGRLLERLAGLKAQTGCRIVAMVYDLIPLTHSHLAFHKDTALFERYYRRVLDVADTITCISEATRSDLAAFAAERELRTPVLEVLHLGDAVQDVSLVAGGDRESFFLWVGTLERRKNFELLYDALRILESEGHDLPRVVVAGHRGWGVNDVLDEIGLRTTAASRALVLLGAVPDSTLASLYSRARALVFPSHYEGWGLPLREAAAHGCPVAAGDTPASREALAGYGGATFLSTNDPAEWAEFLRSEHSASAPLPMRTWADAARDLVTVVEGAVTRSGRGR